MRFGEPVIPAKAGIYAPCPWLIVPAQNPLDSRFRGNDGYAGRGFDGQLRNSYQDSDK